MSGTIPVAPLESRSSFAAGATQPEEYTWDFANLEESE